MVLPTTTAALDVLIRSSQMYFCSETASVPEGVTGSGLEKVYVLGDYQKL